MVEILFMQRSTLNLISIWTLFNLYLSVDGHREDPDRFGQLDNSNGSVDQKPIEPEYETCNKDKCGLTVFLLTPDINFAVLK